MVPLQVVLPLSQLTLQGYQTRPDAKATIVAFHGWLDNCFSFLPLSKELPDINVIAFDWPGHGDSQALPPGSSYDFHLYLMWIHELLEVLKLDHVNLLGHSMGAVAASLYAGAFSEGLASLILIEGLGPFSVPEVETPAKMRNFIQGWSRHTTLRNGLFPSWEEAIKARQKAGRLSYESAELLAQRGAAERDEGQGSGVMWKHDTRHKLPSRFQYSEAQTLAFLGAISCPTLFIEASDSILTDRSLLSPRVAAVFHLQHVHLTGGHHLHMEEPRRVAQSIETFLKNQ